MDEEKEWRPEKLEAFEKDKLIGILKISKQPRFCVYRSKHRGSGARRALMTQAISQAKKMKDTEHLHLSVTSTNEPAKKLSAQLGFTYRKRSHGLISFMKLREQQL
ncbi:GNAT family N-acetyltransferase [Bacillus amyloliquefaciens]|uniref:GNAT family N-acetyltransferase n=1 Tax=Bacillus amyloliquefaciens TaxID=1390 RepID=UPI00336B9B9B